MVPPHRILPHEIPGKRSIRPRTFNERRLGQPATPPTSCPFGHTTPHSMDWPTGIPRTSGRRPPATKRAAGGKPRCVGYEADPGTAHGARSPQAPRSSRRPPTTRRPAGPRYGRCKAPGGNARAGIFPNRVRRGRSAADARREGATRIEPYASPFATPQMPCYGPAHAGRKTPIRCAGPAPGLSCWPCGRGSGRRSGSAPR